MLFGDELEISEYFYYWRKFWEDVRHRISWEDVRHRISYHESHKEKMKVIKRRKKIKSKEKRS